MSAINKKNILFLLPLLIVPIYFIWFLQYDYKTTKTGSTAYELRTHKITGASEICLEENSWVRVKIQGEKITIPAGTVMAIGSRANPSCSRWLP